MRTLVFSAVLALALPAYAGDGHKHHDHGHKHDHKADKHEDHSRGHNHGHGDDHGKSMNAHAHGVGAFGIAFEADGIAMTLEVPGADIVGFEHKAKTDQERTQTAAAVATLAKPLDIFELPEAAGCAVHEANVEVEHEGSHSEFHAEYHLDCAAPNAASEIHFEYFEAFPKAQSLNVVILKGDVADKERVTRADPHLDLHHTH